MDFFTAQRASGEAAFRLFRDGQGLDFRSDYAADRPPRGAQRRSAVIHMGLSMWITEEAALAKNDQFDGKLGDHIALLELDGRLGVWWAQTFSPDHMTIWGRPEDLDRCVRDIRAV